MSQTKSPLDIKALAASISAIRNSKTAGTGAASVAGIPDSTAGQETAKTGVPDANATGVTAHASNTADSTASGINSTQASDPRSVAGNTMPTTLEGDTTETTEASVTKHKSKVASLRAAVLAAVTPIPAAKVASTAVTVITPVPSAQSKVSPTAAVAAADSVKVSFEDLQKLAGCLSTERGRQAVEHLALEQFGAERAAEAIKNAYSFMEDLDEGTKQAAEQEHVNAQIQEAFAQLPLAAQQVTLKCASAFQTITGVIGNDMEKLAAAQFGYESALAYIDTCKPLKTAGEMPPPVEGAEPEMPPVDEASGEMPEAEGEPSIEEIAAVLEELVQSGKVPLEVAQQVIQALVGEDQEAAAAPVEAVGEEAAMKAASIVADLFKAV